MDSELYKQQEDLSTVVEPLVDAISELVLLSVTGRFENVQDVCVKIADRTNKLVVVAQQVASSSTDSELQLEVAQSITTLAASIEKLVTSFIALLSNSNPNTQHDFALAAKQVGEAVNKLVSSTDVTSGQKIIAAVNDCRASVKQVETFALQKSDQLVAAAQEVVDNSVRLVKVATTAAGSTADENKKRMLLDGGQRVKYGSPILIQAAKRVLVDSNARSELSSAYSNLENAFETLLSAARIGAKYYGKVDETYEYVKRLLEAAKNLEKEAANFYEMTTHGTNEDFLAAAKATTSKALQLMESTENAIKMESNPIQKALLRDAATELREASQAVIIAARALRQNPNDPIAKANFENAHHRLEDAIRRVVQTTQGELFDNTPKGKLAASTTALEGALKEMARVAERNPRDLSQEAQIISAIGMQVARDLENYANGVTDPSEKKRLLQEAQDVKNAVQRVINAANRVAANPNDPAAKRELEEATNQLNATLAAIRRDARLDATSDLLSNLEKLTIRDGSEEDQLVQAAKEEAAAALQLAKEADLLAKKITDPLKRQKIQTAIGEVKVCSQRVVEAADLVHARPHDAAAQQKLTVAQKDLGVAIEKVVALTGEKDVEIDTAMAEMKQQSGGAGSEQAILITAQQMLDEIARTFSGNLKGQAAIENAKQMSLKATDFARQLKELADKTQDPVYKEKLYTASKIIRDGSLQIKILSAVRAAGGEDSANTVGMAVKGLQANIQDIMKDVTAENIRNKFRSTVKTTIAINKVVKHWQKKSGVRN